MVLRKLKGNYSGNTPWSNLMGTQLGYLPNQEFEINTVVAGGKAWPRVTNTNVSGAGWAFCYKIGNRIKTTFYTSALTGIAPSSTPTAYTTDITVDTCCVQVTSLNSNGTSSVQQITHDEPDICWHPNTSSVIYGWNVRLGASTINPPGLQGHIMDQRFRISNASGTFLSATDSYSTYKTLESQWRPLIEPMLVSGNASSFLYSFTGNDKDSAFINIISSISPFGFVTSADRQMPNSIGSNRQVDQNACELPDGYIFCAWNIQTGAAGVPAGQLVRWRILDPSGNRVGTEHTLSAVFTEGPNAIQFGKEEPRVKCLNNRIWLVYQLEGNPGVGEYEGVGIYATVFNYDSTTHTASVLTPEFKIHRNLMGIQRRPEIVLYSNKCLVVCEHYPSGSISTANVPIYNGPSLILLKGFRATGIDSTRNITVNTDRSLSGANQFLLRPDIAISQDETQAMICWTAAPNNNIYNITGNTAKIFARVLSIPNLPQ